MERSRDAETTQATADQKVILRSGKLQEQSVASWGTGWTGGMTIGVVITFDEAEKKTWITVSETDLERYIGHEASFQFSKTKDFKGKVIGVETDFLVIKFEEQPLGLGQGSQVSVAD